MQEVNELVQQAMGILTTFLPFAALKVSEGFLKEPGVKLFDWLEAKVRGTPAEATLQRAVAEPGDEDVRGMLELEIKRLARQHEDFLQELRAQVAAAGGGTTANQTAHASGNAKITQIAGNNNRVG